MNTPGVKISSYLARLGIGFFVLVILGIIIWPHLWSAKASIPEVPVTHFAAPPSPIATPSISHLMPAVSPVQSTPVPKARPTPCQPCIEAAKEVLARYLAAIRTGAGADNREEQRNVYEAPQVGSNTNHPVYVPGVSGNEQSHF
jgi:cell division septation protein DedD